MSLLRKLASFRPAAKVPQATGYSSLSSALTTAAQGRSERMPLAVRESGGYYTLPVEFTGSGSEYFRIWIVNMVLLLVTLGLYWPWAKVRRLRYFWSNTLVGGEPLAFHGDARKMLRGQALVGVLFLLLSWVGEVSALAGVVALAAVALLWPALWRSSMQFRMANTSWRGIRLHFAGSMPQAYRALLPLFVPALLLAGLGLFAPPGGPPPAWVGLAALGVMLGSVALLPRLFWNLKSYQHRHYAIGLIRTGFRAQPRAFYGLVFKFVGMVLAAALLVVLGSWLLVRGLGPVLGLGFLWLLPLLTLGVLALLAVSAWPWWQTRMQNLVWTETGSRQIRFISRLSFRKMLRLRLKNAVLMLLTLGLYWPFAAVASARLRLEAVQVRSRVDVATLLAAAVAAGEAAGDAAGDLLGMDIGL